MHGLRLVCTLMILLGAGEAGAYPDGTEIRVPEVTGMPGDTLSLPVVVGDVGEYSVTSADVKIRYDARVVQAIGMTQEGTQTAGWSAAYNVTATNSTGSIDISMASATDAIKGNGVLAFVRFVVSFSAQEGNSTSLMLEEATLNSSVTGPSIFPWDGSIRIAESVSPQVICTIPSRNAKVVYSDATVSIFFNTPMDPLGFEDMVMVEGSTGRTYLGQMSYDSEYRALIFDPTELFASKETVTVRVKAMR